MSVGPSIDYIELEWIDKLQVTDRDQSAYLYLLPFWQSYDPLVSERAWILRCVVDFFWEWVAVAIALAVFGLLFWLVYARVFYRRREYTTIPSSSNTADAEGMYSNNGINKLQLTAFFCHKLSTRLIILNNNFSSIYFLWCWCSYFCHI